MGIVVFKAFQPQKKNHFSEAKQREFNLMLETQVSHMCIIKGFILQCGWKRTSGTSGTSGTSVPPTSSDLCHHSDELRLSGWIQEPP